MRKLILIVNIEKEKYDFNSPTDYQTLLLQCKKFNASVNQVLIDVNSKIVYAYSDDSIKGRVNDITA